MLQRSNDTPFAVGIAALPNADGVDSLQVVVQGTFTLAKTPAIADEQQPLVAADRWCGEPGEGELERLGAFVIDKLGTDVFVTGHACAPDERPTERSVVSVAVGERRKVVAVHGDRTWLAGGRISAPRPFTRMPLTWARAFGGPSPSDKRPDVEAACRNPVGMGLGGDALPNLEDADHPITDRSDRPPPACFAPIAPGWLPRRPFAGTYDAAWVRRRAPRLPTDFDPQFFTAAALAFDQPLVGGESMELVGVSPHGPLRLEVPKPALRIEVCAAGQWDETRTPSLDSIHVLPDDELMVLTWRATVEGDRRLLSIERVHVGHREGSAAA